MYTERKTKNIERFAITEWLEANFSQFVNQKTAFFELRDALKKAIGDKVTSQNIRTLLEEVAHQQGYNVRFETETIEAERRKITVFVLTKSLTPSDKNTNDPKLIARLSINLFDIDDEKEELTIKCNGSKYSITRLTEALINNADKMEVRTTVAIMGTIVKVFKQYLKKQ
jgi:hypothetical protein